MLFFLESFSSLNAFFSFHRLAFVGFLLSSKDAIFMLSRFSLTTVDSQGTLYLGLSLIGMHTASVSKEAVTNLSYSSFGICHSDVS